MKKILVLPLAAAGLLGLGACTSHETENVTVNETSNVAATDLNTIDATAVDANATDNSAAALGDAANSSNGSDALTNG